MTLRNSEYLSPETVGELRIELAGAQTKRDELDIRVKRLRSIGQDFKLKRIKADNVYDRALAAAEKAKAIVNAAGQDLRAADVDVAKAQEAASRAKGTLSDADDKATAAQGFAKELNAPDAIRKRNERYAMALDEAAVASNNATAAQETASLATKTAKELAAVASVAPLRQYQETDVQQAITRGGAVAGAIGIAILVLQIFVNSMRYYARLAEFYDAQADALLASGNNPALASEFLEKFSPALIDFGKAPVSLYEKALDTVGKVAGRAAGRGKN